MKVICLHCQKLVKYNITSELDKGEIGGIIIDFYRKVARCRECGNEVWIGKLDDKNADTVYRKYLKLKKRNKL